MEVTENNRDKPETDLEMKIRMTERLLQGFKPERIMYLTFTGVCALVLLLVAVYHVLFQENDWQAFAALFAPAGGLMHCCGRLIKMWSDSMRIIHDFK